MKGIEIKKIINQLSLCGLYINEVLFSMENIFSDDIEITSGIQEIRKLLNTLKRQKIKFQQMSIPTGFQDAK